MSDKSSLPDRWLKFSINKHVFSSFFLLCNHSVLVFGVLLMFAYILWKKKKSSWITVVIRDDQLKFTLNELTDLLAELFVDLVISKGSGSGSGSNSVSDSDSDSRKTVAGDYFAYICCFKTFLLPSNLFSVFNVSNRQKKKKAFFSVQIFSTTYDLSVRYFWNCQKKKVFFFWR